MKAILKGGPAGGKECDVAPTTRKIQVPILENPRAQWYEDDEDIPGPTFGAVIYSRTDERQDGAVVFSCGVLDNH